MMSKARKFLAVVMVVFVLVTAVHVLAQGQQDGAVQSLTTHVVEQAATAVNTQEIVGVVDAMTADTITVDGNVINIASAEIKTSLQVGELVTVHYVVATDGTWVASEVDSVLAGVTNCPEVTESAPSGPEVTDSAPSGPEVTQSVTNCPEMTEAATESPEMTEVVGDNHSETRATETPEPSDNHSSVRATETPEPTQLHQSDQQQNQSQSDSKDNSDSEQGD